MAYEAGRIWIVLECAICYTGTNEMLMIDILDSTTKITH